MSNYLLSENEVILYKGKGNVGTEIFTDASSDIILTNLYLVEIIKTKKLFKKEETRIESYPISKIKLYEGLPHIRQEDKAVIIYFSNEEVVVNFDTKINMIKFMNAVNKLITGKSVSERSAEKAKGALNLVDNTLGIKTVDTVKGVLENGVVGTVFRGTRKKKRRNKTKNITNNISDIVGATDRIFSDEPRIDVEEMTNKSKEKSLDEQIRMLKELKELVDAGILSEEEFNQKKKEILDS